MPADTPLGRAKENATGLVSMLVTGTWLAALFLNVDWWLPFMLFGYVVVVPVTAILFGDEADRVRWWEDAEEPAYQDEPPREGPSARRREPTDTNDALQTLRDRYARGELTEEQFERKLERLLETETVEDAAEHSSTSPRDEWAESDRARDRSADLDEEFETEGA